MNYYEALIVCRDRYLKMMADVIFYGSTGKTQLHTRTSLDDVYDFTRYEFSKGIFDKLPLTKLNRWLGYIQGQLIAREITTVEAEHSWVELLFSPLNFEIDDG